MKKIFFTLLTVAFMAAGCSSEGELGCYEFNIEKTEIRENERGRTETQLESESVEFCGLTNSEAAGEARDMSKTETREETIDGMLTTITVIHTATYHPVS